MNYAPLGLWSVRFRESEKVLLEAPDIIREVQRYWEALYVQQPVNLPAFERNGGRYRTTPCRTLKTP